MRDLIDLSLFWKSDFDLCFQFPQAVKTKKFKTSNLLENKKMEIGMGKGLSFSHREP